MNQADSNISIIGPYGKWAASLIENKLPSMSYRQKEWTDIRKWKKRALTRLQERLAIPDIGGIPVVTVKKQYAFDGLQMQFF